MSWLSRQAGDEAEQVQRDLVGDLRWQRFSNLVLPVAVRQQITHEGRAARCGVARRFAEVGVPEHVIPIRMRRETCHNGLPQLANVVREAGHFVARYPGSISNTPARPCTTTELFWSSSALVDQHALSDLRQHGAPSARGQG